MHPNSIYLKDSNNKTIIVFIQMVVMPFTNASQPTCPITQPRLLLQGLLQQRSGQSQIFVSTYWCKPTKLRDPLVNLPPTLVPTSLGCRVTNYIIFFCHLMGHNLLVIVTIVEGLLNEIFLWTFWTQIFSLKKWQMLTFNESQFDSQFSQGQIKMKSCANESYHQRCLMKKCLNGLN
jgi:hypothetical protein